MSYRKRSVSSQAFWVLLVVVAAGAAVVLGLKFSPVAQVGPAARAADPRPPRARAAETAAVRGESPPGEAARQPELQRVGDAPGDGGRLLFADGQSGWLADEKSLWRSDDGGHTWSLAHAGKDQTDVTMRLAFRDARAGWMLRPSGLYRTADGGASWTKLPTPLDYPRGSIDGFHFLPDGQTGWLAGGVYRPVSRKELLENQYPNNLVASAADGSSRVLHQAILATKDGGKTWRTQSLPFEAGVVYGVAFHGAGRGVAYGSPGLFFTEDGGGRWRPAVFDSGCVDEEFRDFPDSRPVSVAFAGDGLAWLSWDDGRLMKSGDGGRTWCDLLRPEEVWPDGEQNAYFVKLHFNGPSHGWGLKANGELQKTADGGRTWARLGLNARAKDVSFSEGYGLVATTEGLFRLRY